MGWSCTPSARQQISDCIAGMGNLRINQQDVVLKFRVFVTRCASKGNANLTHPSLTRFEVALFKRSRSSTLLRS